MTVFSRLVPCDVASVRAQLQRLSQDDRVRLQDELTALDDAVAARFTGMTRLYHGAPPRIAEAIRERGFALTKGRRSGFLGGTHEVDNLALFLTENRALAAAFGTNRTDRYGENGEVLEVYADLRQPLDMTTWTRVPKPLRMLGEALLGQKRPKQEDLFWLVDQPAFVTAVRDLGYDAIRFTESAETVKALGLGRKDEVTVGVFDPARLHVAPPPRGSLGSLLWHLEHTEPPMMRRRNPRNPQTETSASSAAKGAAFRRWFGKSKVVDAEGSPRVVYHGTAYAPGQPPITEFRGPHQPYRYPAFTGGKIVGVGSFFSESEEVAASYPYLFLPETQNYARVVHTLYLRIERPKVYRTVRAAAADMIDRTRAERLVHGKETGDPVAFVALLRAEGYDGITFMEGPSYAPTSAKKKARVWVAFDPRQVKSATDNAGTFDPADPSTLRNPRTRSRR